MAPRVLEGTHALPDAAAAATVLSMIARRALALHLGIGVEAICEIDELEADWGIDPFDLILVVLQIGQIAGVDVAIGDLDGVVTVADLEAVVERQRCATTLPCKSAG